MKIIQSILALLGASEASGFQSSAPNTGDCGYADDINAQIVRELGKGEPAL